MSHPAPDPAPAPSPLQRALGRLSSAAVAVAGVAMLGLVAVQGWQVFARYVLNDSPSWTEPVTLLLLSTAMSFGAAAGVHEQRHFRFHLLAEAMPVPLRRASEAIAALVIVAIGATLAWWGARLLLDGLDIRMAGAPLPQSIGFLPLALGGLLMAGFALPRLAAAFAAGEGGR
ncbi:TRAP transporter small permease [Luteimonas sp. RD2P54]|uniref:TRAP transporter small permease protein n=1 Tax=Luteimonas endophytica TaxID=3042023 RepID=A0ABT6J6G1_9GAMM|nr:TRAP transporter small permease [Luteimonas endophytica]MDH5822416.1 TRAP transporter small permease [Luteimonas endophytica]